MTLKLTYEQSGSGTALILLHGLFGSGRNLKSISRHLASGYSVYMPDLRNHGDSPHHEVMDYVTMADDIDRLITDDNMEQAILVGHSMGGKVAMVNALQNPDTVTALVVLDIAPASYSFEYTHIIDALLDLDLDSLSSRKDADRILGEHYQNPVFRQFLLQNLVRQDGRFTWRLNLEAVRRNLDSIRTFPEMHDRVYTGPALFLGGENSDYISTEHEAGIKRLFPNCDIRMVPDAGHWLHAEQGETVNREIADFLERSIMSDPGE